MDVLDEQQQICLPEGQGVVFGLSREKEERKALEICILNGKWNLDVVLLDTGAYVPSQA